jgi:signal transduction histidine kinase
MGIIEEILTFSRAEAGREEIHIEEIPPTVMVEEAISLVQPQASAKGLQVKVVDETLPAVIRTDRGKLRQILVNLLGNAVKFTDSGEVEVRAYQDGETVCFAIRDTGPGIPTVEIERIFEPFTQVDYSLTRVKGGTGLGLAVSRRLAVLLGGSLTVESTVGAGSLFTICLPLESPG